jgi:hypothetical protein
MSLRVRFQYQTGFSLGYSIERLSDGLFWDFASQGAGTGQTFTANPGVTIASLPEDSGNFTGRYKATLTPTPIAQFTNGDYCITIHDLAAGNVVVSELTTAMYSGDDAPFFSVDLWSVPLPGTYASGTAGQILGANLDARMSTVKAKTDNLPSNPAAVGSAMVLAANGLDQVIIETGINARQAMSANLAVSAGKISGAGTGTITVKGAGVSVTRLTVSGDSAGNRTAVTLNLPT